MAVENKCPIVSPSLILKVQHIVYIVHKLESLKFILMLNKLKPNIIRCRIRE